MSMVAFIFMIGLFFLLIWLGARLFIHQNKLWEMDAARERAQQEAQ